MLSEEANSKLNEITDIITKQQRKLIRKADLLSAIEAQRQKCSTLIEQKQKIAVYALVLLQVLLFLRDGIEGNPTEDILKTPSEELNEQIVLHAKKLFGLYQQSMPPKDFCLPSDAPPSLLNLFEKALEGDVNSCLLVSEHFDELKNMDAVRYWVEIAFEKELAAVNAKSAPEVPVIAEIKETPETVKVPQDISAETVVDAPTVEVKAENADSDRFLREMPSTETLIASTEKEDKDDTQSHCSNDTLNVPHTEAGILPKKAEDIDIVENVETNESTGNSEQSDLMDSLKVETVEEINSSDETEDKTEHPIVAYREVDVELANKVVKETINTLYASGPAPAVSAKAGETATAKEVESEPVLVSKYALYPEKEPASGNFFWKLLFFGAVTAALVQVYYTNW